MKSVMRQIVKRVSDSHIVTIEEIMGRSRKRRVFIARREAVMQCVNAGFSVTKVARFFALDHATVIYHVNENFAERKREMMRSHERKPRNYGMDGLTPKQAAGLKFIRDYMASHSGIAPSYDEIAVALHYTNRSQPHAVITALERRGYITRDPGRHRSIKLRDDIHPLAFLGAHHEAFLAQCEAEHVTPETKLREIVADYLGVGA